MFFFCFVFNLLNPSSRNIKTVFTQPLTEMSTRNLLGDKGWETRKADNLTAIYVGASTSHNPMSLL
jgi:hypothetical protein